MKCRVCGRELLQFDDIIYRCEGDMHKHTAIVNVHSGTVEFESIRIYREDRTWFNFIFNNLANYSQIARGKSLSTYGVNSLSLHEEEIPLYHEPGILDIDLTSMDKLLEKLETLETFS